MPWPATPEQGTRWAVGLVAAGALVLGALQGGYAPSRYAPFAVLVLWAVVVARVVPGRPATSGPARIAIAASVLLTGWTALSITWAATPGAALDATGRTVLYAAVLGLALLPRWPAASLRRLLVLVAAGAVLLAVGTVAWVDLATDPTRWVIDGRLVAPTGYVNATAGLWGIALVVLVHLASGGLRSPGGRVLALTGAGVVLQTSLLSQSRGAVLALVVATAVLVVLSPHRGAVLLVVAALAAATLPVAPGLLDVRGAPDAAALADGLHGASGRIALAALGLALLGAAWQVALARMGEVRREALSSRALGLATAGTLAAVLAVGAVAAIGNPVTWVGDKADQALHGGYGEVAPTGSRLTGELGSDRGDLYRVALDLFASRPLNGVGAEDFQAAYLRERDSQESARYAHSLPLGVLAGIGLVGGLLLLVALAVPLLAALRGRSGLDDPARAGSAAALAAFVAWAAGATWDWTWEFPALTVLAFVLLGAAARATGTAGAAPSPELLAVRERARAHGIVVPDDRPSGPWLPSRGAARARLAGVVVAVAATTVVLAALGGSSYFLRKGTAQSSQDPEAAATSLARAARLNPLDGDAPLSRAVVVRRLGDVAGWRADLEETIDRAPEDWFAHLELGMAQAQAGERDAALSTLRRAARLNPNQPTVRDVLAAVERGDRVDPGEVEAIVAGRLATRLRSIGTSP
ncbi:M48 family metallopeptidase [Patulibacter sp.]|uniref:tetratricopeptide repeat protein n=1 Tax=Patulibacter sp. TaxID=1912859 RepID=UPI0027156DBD|nr:O-antigen ligase family protein [Patulibacter sp.]MDO9407238.1 O-antigen ligase family protein [Patulibacter sp.]